MKIGELAKLLGVSHWILRDFAGQGVIPSKRAPGRCRRFPASTLPQIRAALIEAGVIDPDAPPIVERKRQVGAAVR